MALEIRSVRPALLDDSLAVRIDELRAFRHVFRNVYQSSLDPGRVRALQERLPEVMEGFAGAHGRFLEQIRAVADQL